jgi:hypothetical protein
MSKRTYDIVGLVFTKLMFNLYAISYAPLISYVAHTKYDTLAVYFAEQLFKFFCEVFLFLGGPPAFFYGKIRI